MCLGLLAISVQAQHTLSIDAQLNEETQTISITQKIIFVNDSNSALSEIYLLDWANSFSSKTTPLAERFAENFNSSFHFEKDENRGRTVIQSIQNNKNDSFTWTREPSDDIIKINLENGLEPNAQFEINLAYTVKVPNDKYTRYGVSKNGDYKLRYWFIAPAVFKSEWRAYSNKNVDDFFMSPSKFIINFHFPKEYKLFSDLDVTTETIINNKKIIHYNA